jgi:hypothetical protein
MRLPRKLIALGDCIEIHFMGTAGWLERYRPGKNATLCCADRRNSNTLWILKTPGKPQRFTGQSVAFEAFHDLEPDTYKRVRLNPRGELTKSKLIVTAIVYRSKKWTNRPTEYIHHFKTRPSVYTDRATNPSFIKISGGKIRVRPEGITG